MIKCNFNKRQLALLERLGVDGTAAYSDDDWDDIRDKVHDLLMYEGFNDDNTPNDVGRICEEIIDITYW